MAKEKTPVSEMTREEYQSLREELENLKTVERNEISEKIRIARGFGDLSENSEYDEAKNDQARLEARISRLEEQLKNVTIVETVNTDFVTIGTKVVLLDMEFGDEAEYRIGSSAASSGEDVITVDSPVGRAIIGKRVEDVVDIDTPSKKIYQMKIISISK
ncbi:transcription elongation factor GreA [Oscillospiraceae bacterium LTW-04]|nr:transcription elongation factor GreA [Oscillospiraceae bacterium MB24-C1]